MTTTSAEHVTAGDLADQAAAAVQALIHHTRPGTAGLSEPSDVADVIAALTSMTGMLPQLFDQLTRWLQHEHENGRLRVDALAPMPDPVQAVQTLTDSLRRAAQDAQRACTELDTAHERDCCTTG